MQFFFRKQDVYFVCTQKRRVVLDRGRTVERSFSIARTKTKDERITSHKFNGLRNTGILRSASLWGSGNEKKEKDKQQAYPSVRRWAHLERLIGGTLISLSQMEDRFRLGIERQDVRLPAYRLHFRGFPERFEVRPAKRV